MSESPSQPSSTEIRRAPAAERWRDAGIGACLGVAVTLFASAVYPPRPSAAIPPDLARDLAEATAAGPSAPAPTTLSAATAETSACGATVPCPPSTPMGAPDAGRPVPDSSMRR